MGARIVKFDFRPRENEQLDVVVKVPEDKRSVIHGVVKNYKDELIKDAVVKLYEVVDKSDCSDLKPLTHTFTDEYGQFMFGPLCHGKKYAIKVWYGETNHREFTIAPEGDPNAFCLGASKLTRGPINPLPADDEE